MNRLRVFIKKHNLSSGNANESILRDFLAKHAHGEVRVGQGFICDPFEQVSVSKQCDILIYDQNNYPIVYSDGPITVVLPGAVRMVIEVKTRLNEEHLIAAVGNIMAAREVSPYSVGVIFAFRSIKYETIIKHLKNYTAPNSSPTAILLLDQGIIIHSYAFLRFREQMEGDPLKPTTTLGSTSSYAIRRSKVVREKGTFVITFLLLLFFHAIRANGLFESIPANALIHAMEEYTEKLGDDFHIGEREHEKHSDA
jgi:hypothetical protein